MDLVARGKMRTEAFRSGECSTCAWSDYCFSVWEENESVCLLYGVAGKKARQFQEVGFPSWREDVAEYSCRFISCPKHYRGKGTSHLAKRMCLSEGNPTSH